MGNSHLQNLRSAMWSRDPHCHWCGCLTILPPRPSPRFTGDKLPPETATIDHLFSKAHGAAKNASSPVVLACSTCNDLRNKIEHKARAGKRLPDLRSAVMHRPPETKAEWQLRLERIKESLGG